MLMDEKGAMFPEAFFSCTNLKWLYVSNIVLFRILAVTLFGRYLEHKLVQICEENTLGRSGDSKLVLVS